MCRRGGRVSQEGQKLDFGMEIRERGSSIWQAPTVCTNEFGISLNFLKSPSMLKLFPFPDEETKALRHVSYLKSHER